MTARLVRGALLVLGAYLIAAWIVADLNPAALRMVGLNEIGKPGTEHRFPLVLFVVLAPKIVGAAVGGFVLGYSSQGFRLRWLGISLASVFMFATCFPPDGVPMAPSGPVPLSALKSTMHA